VACFFGVLSGISPQHSRPSAPTFHAPLAADVPISVEPRTKRTDGEAATAGFRTENEDRTSKRQTVWDGLFQTLTLPSPPQGHLPSTSFAFYNFWLTCVGKNPPPVSLGPRAGTSGVILPLSIHSDEQPRGFGSTRMSEAGGGNNCDEPEKKRNTHNFERNGSGSTVPIPGQVGITWL